MPETDDDLLVRLKAADPAARLDVHEAHLTRLMARRPRRRLWIIGGIIGALAVGAAAPATAGAVHDFLAQTGQYGSGSGEVADTTEWIDVTAPDAAEYMTTLYPDYLPIPSSVDEQRFRERVVDVLITTAKASSADEGGAAVMQQSTGLVRTFEAATYAEWIRTWLEADAAGDSAARAEATSAMRAACEWPAIVTTDGGGIVDLMKRFADAAERNDRTGVLVAAEYNADFGTSGWDGELRTWWLEQ